MDRRSVSLSNSGPAQMGRPCIFTIKGTDDVKYYWTGNTGRDGYLERSMHRADARKFPSSAVALEVADTHPELRNSTEWKIAPFRPREKVR